MLHEVLLALSGHPSPLFRNSHLDQDVSTDFPLLSPSEKALLQSIGQLSELHRKLREHIEHIAAQHASMVCRAVATSIRQTHLSRFQDKILAVESRILSKDASIVGAYDIVPLASIVGEFDDWHRRMAWYWEIACFIKPRSTLAETDKSSGCSGAALIDKLRMEQQTGFPDIEQVAVELSKVAETAWLRQIAPWLSHGKLPTFGDADFFIQLSSANDTNEARFVKDRDKLPKFVTSSTASSILFIGKSLHQVHRYEKQARMSTDRSSKEPSANDSPVETLQHLTSLPLPIVPAQLSRTISAIRLSVSQNVLRHLLPMQTTLALLACLKEFFLLSRSEFPAALINEVDSRLTSRQQNMGKLLQQDPMKALQGLSLKDSELQQTLSATWRSLASRDEDLEDDILDFARKHVSLSLPGEHDSRPSTADSVHGASATVSSIAFNDFLFPNATSLSLKISPPLDLFISPREVEVYSAINAYLIAIRRAQSRLTDLWRRTNARRDHPAPRQQSHNTLISSESGRRSAARRVGARKVWATCSAAIFLVSEASGYFEGEIIRESWQQFESWVTSPISNEQAEDTQLSASTGSVEDAVQRDPETLAAGHRAFLAALTYALLLNDVPFTRELRSLLGNIDHLIAFFNRLLDVQQKLDLELDDVGGETAYTVEEEQRYSLELDRARKKVDSDMKSVVSRLRQLDHERIGAGRYLSTDIFESAGFEPWRGGGVDRLLMKLEFGRVDEAATQLV